MKTLVSIALFTLLLIAFAESATSKVRSEHGERSKRSVVAILLTGAGVGLLDTTVAVGRAVSHTLKKHNYKGGWAIPHYPRHGGWAWTGNGHCKTCKILRNPGGFLVQKVLGQI